MNEDKKYPSLEESQEAYNISLEDAERFGWFHSGPRSVIRTTEIIPPLEEEEVYAAIDGVIETMRKLVGSTQTTFFTGGDDTFHADNESQDRTVRLELNDADQLTEEMVVTLQSYLSSAQPLWRILIREETRELGVLIYPSTIRLGRVFELGRWQANIGHWRQFINDKVAAKTRPCRMQIEIIKPRIEVAVRELTAGEYRVLGIFRPADLPTSDPDEAEMCAVWTLSRVDECYNSIVLGDHDCWNLGTYYFFSDGRLEEFPKVDEGVLACIGRMRLPLSKLTSVPIKWESFVEEQVIDLSDMEIEQIE